MQQCTQRSYRCQAAAGIAHHCIAPEHAAVAGKMPHWDGWDRNAYTPVNIPATGLIHCASVNSTTHLLPGAAALTYFTNRISPASRISRLRQLLAAGTLMTPLSLSSCKPGSISISRSLKPVCRQQRQPRNTEPAPNVMQSWFGLAQYALQHAPAGRVESMQTVQKQQTTPRPPADAVLDQELCADP